METKIALLPKYRSNQNQTSRVLQTYVMTSKLVKKIDPQGVYEHSKKFIDRLDFTLKHRNVDFNSIFKGSLWFETLTKLDAKCDKRSVIEWVSSFHKAFLKCYVLCECQTVKNLVITYVYFGFIYKRAKVKLFQRNFGLSDE